MRPYILVQLGVFLILLHLYFGFNRNVFRCRYGGLFAKKKASKYVSDELLGALEAEGSISTEQVSSNSNESKAKKKANKFISEDLLQSIEVIDTESDSVDHSTTSDKLSSSESSNNNSSTSKKKKKKKAKFDFDNFSFDDLDKETVVEEIEKVEPPEAVNAEPEEDSNNEDEESLGDQLVDGMTVEQRIRKEKPKSRIRFAESSQPDFVMMSLDHVSLVYGNEVIIKDSTLSVSTGQRVGLVGPNGSGKTTQLKILAGELEPTSGDVVKSSKDIRVAMLRQEFLDELNMTRTLREELLASFDVEQKILDDITACEDEVARTTDDPERMEKVLNRLQDLQEQALAKGVYALDSKVDKIMDATGFSSEDGASLVKSFSGGWKMRIGLAKILLKEPNVLLLDEPTNHLDLDSVYWLEDFLVKQSIPMVIVSHDREFLDKVCNRIVDVEEGSTVNYDGNYSNFIASKQERLEQWREKYERQLKYIKEEEKWIKKAKNDPHMAQQVKEKEMQLDAYKNDPERVPIPPKDKKFRFRFPPSPRCGESVIEGQGLGHGYGEGQYKILFQDVNIQVNRMERVGFVGPNGSGKSTLMRILAGREDPKHGFAEYGSANVIANYFAQNAADEFDLEKTVLETVMDDAPTDYSMTDIRALLGQFMFKGDDANKQLKVLSGGEKARVALCKMMLRPANLLLLDEPTNVSSYFLISFMLTILCSTLT